MKGISGFFERIKNLQMREMYSRVILAEMIKKHAGVEVEAAAISFSGDKAVIRKLGSVERSAVFMKKAKILGDFHAAQSARKVADIGF